MHCGGPGTRHASRRSLHTDHFCRRPQPGSCRFQKPQTLNIARLILLISHRAARPGKSRASSRSRSDHAAAHPLNLEGARLLGPIPPQQELGSVHGPFSAYQGLSPPAPASRGTCGSDMGFPPATHEPSGVYHTFPFPFFHIAALTQPITARLKTIRKRQPLGIILMDRVYSETVCRSLSLFFLPVPRQIRHVYWKRFSSLVSRRLPNCSSSFAVLLCASL